MIWLRRFLIIPLGLVFFVLFILTLLIFRLNETFLEPEFYKEQLAKADIYDFVLGELSTSGIEELRSKDIDFFSETQDENPLVTTGLTTDEIVSSFGRALPPSWVQEQLEQVIDQAGGYITGERDSFEITVTASERVTATTQEVEALVRKAQLYDLLFDEIVSPEIDNALVEEGTLPFNVSLSGEDIVLAVQRVAPEDWVKDQVFQALDEVTAYVVGDQETFEINVQLAERADVALEEMKTLLMKANFFELLFDEVMDPLLEGNLSQFTQLPFGVSITQEEISSALRELVPPSWLEEKALGIIDEAGPYLTGKTDSFKAVIPLSDRRDVALTIIEDLAESKLNALVEGLPECSVGQLPFSGVFPSLNEVPQCVPPGLEVETLIDLLDIDITGGVGEMIGSQIPDEMVYTEADLRQALGGDADPSNLEVLDNVREIIGQGWTYTEVDLREDLGQDKANVLDDVRAALSDGFTYTDADLREDLADADEGAVLDNLDTFRAQFSRARDLRFLVYILWALLLAIIGVLGGRHWWSKIAWAATTLGISAAILFVAAGPVYDAVAQGQIDDLRVEALEDMEGTGLLAAEKGLDLAQTVADDFLVGIGRSSLTLLIAAVVILGAALVWPKVSGRRGAGLAQGVRAKRRRRRREG